MSIYYNLGKKAAFAKLGFAMPRHFDFGGYAKSIGTGAAVGGAGGYLAAPEDRKGTGVALGALGGGVLGGVGKDLINRNITNKYRDFKRQERAVYRNQQMELDPAITAHYQKVDDIGKELKTHDNNFTDMLRNNPEMTNEEYEVLHAPHRAKTDELRNQLNEKRTARNALEDQAREISDAYHDRDDVQQKEYLNRLGRLF